MSQLKYVIPFEVSRFTNLNYVEFVFYFSPLPIFFIR